MHSTAKAIHAELAPEGLCKGLKFPDPATDGFRDMVHDAGNVSRRGDALLAYYTELCARPHTLPPFLTALGYSVDELRARRCRVADKVRDNPGLIRRAMLYLRITGEVLCHDDASGAAGTALAERVFLEPQRLVDVMKELVRHDLQAQLEDIEPARYPDFGEIRSLGEVRGRLPVDSASCTARWADAARLRCVWQTFLRKGVLDRRLLPWLWRQLPTVTADPAQMDFLVDLLAQLGLLTELPDSQPPQWLLPMRLPDRAYVLATENAHDRFARFLLEMEGGDAEADVSLAEAIDSIARTGTLTAADLARGSTAALAHADKVLGGAERDSEGLSRDQIGAIHMYTQEDMSGLAAPVPSENRRNVYRPLNSSLRELDYALIRPFWLYLAMCTFSP